MPHISTYSRGYAYWERKSGLLQQMSPTLKWLLAGSFAINKWVFLLLPAAAAGAAVASLSCTRRLCRHRLYSRDPPTPYSSTADVVFHAHGHCVPCMSRASFSGSGGMRRGGGGGTAAKLDQASQGTAGLAGWLVGYVGDWKREGEHFPLLANAPKRPNNFRARRNLCSNSGESRCFYGNS